jgi:uncharacterized protein YlxW (UPF0749 family)
LNPVRMKMMKITKDIKPGRLALMVVCLILGLMLALQFKNVQQVGGNVSLQRSQELTAEIQKLKNENEDLTARIAEYTATIQSYEESVGEQGNYYDALTESLNQTRIFAGMVPVKGPGVVVTINNKYLYYDGDNQSQVVRNVYYEDLLKLVNELNAAGAEALSINGERIVATTEIRNAGDYIVINTNRYSVPFDIQAIGNPDKLMAALNLLGGVVDNLSELIDISLRTEKEILIPAYAGPLHFTDAVPAGEQ